jgi:hypothetical protein
MFGWVFTYMEKSSRFKFFEKGNTSIIGEKIVLKINFLIVVINV